MSGVNELSPEEKNNALNGAFAYCAAKTMMPPEDFVHFIAWAEDLENVGISGMNIDQPLILELNRRRIEPAWAPMTEALSELRPAMGEFWDPHRRALQILNAISKMIPIQHS